MRPLFSIITACYNARAALMITAQSLEQQVFKDFEWIVIDGGSVDGTTELIVALPNVTSWVSEPDQGIADAWNKGIRLCKGSQVMFLNAGDTYDKLMLETFSHHVSEEYITCCHTRLGNGTSSDIFFARPNLLWRGMHVPHNWCSVPLYKYTELGFYKNLKNSMDFEWFSRYFKRYGIRGFKVIDKALGQYALGGHSDKNYIDGFRENERILVGLGVNKFKARIIRYIYISKHFLRYYVKLR